MPSTDRVTDQAEPNLSTARRVMQRFAERVHDKFLEVDKHLKAVPQPEEAESHAKEGTVCKQNPQMPLQEESSWKSVEIDHSEPSAAVGNDAAAAAHDQKGVIFADTKLWLCPGTTPSTYSMMH